MTRDRCERRMGLYSTGKGTGVYGLDELEVMTMMNRIFLSGVVYAGAMGKVG